MSRLQQQVIVSLMITLQRSRQFGETDMQVYSSGLLKSEAELEVRKVIN